MALVVSHIVTVSYMRWMGQPSRQGEQMLQLGWALPFIVWVFLFLFVFATTGGGVAGWNDAIQLARHGRPATGTVVKTEHHGGCEYTYTVGAVHYSHSTSNCAVAVGDTMLVSFLPERPSVSYADAPGVDLRNQLLIGVGAPTLFSVLIAIAVWRYRSIAGGLPQSGFL